MRVIAGTAKRLSLKTIEGLETRPTTDRIKETLFNMINQGIADCDFLDLFSGSGGIGIEALSRGAKSAVFVENNRVAIECINMNLHNTGLSKNANVISMDVLSAIRTLELQNKVFDIIFMDPPYDQLLEKKVLEALEHSSIIYCDTIIIIEASIRTSFDYIENTKFNVIKEKNYKTNKHVFIELKNN
jgi:16S rRNA (guanine966-N2)-methyltransferase